MKFTKEFLQDGNYRLIDETMLDKTRWSIIYQGIFEFEGKYYKTKYSIGGTEYQDERPYEYDSDEIECPEVHQVEKLIKVWEEC